jgi:hypothetical protein
VLDHCGVCIAHALLIEDIHGHGYGLVESGLGGRLLRGFNVDV